MGKGGDYNWLTTTNDEMNGVNEMDIKVQSGDINFNDEMKKHFLEESDSIFEAVDKYKEWENNNKNK